jgi:hypothetical protein
VTNTFTPRSESFVYWSWVYECSTTLYYTTNAFMCLAQYLHTILLKQSLSPLTSVSSFTGAMASAFTLGRARPVHAATLINQIRPYCYSIANARPSTLACLIIHCVGSLFRSQSEPCNIIYTRIRCKRCRLVPLANWHWRVRPTRHTRLLCRSNHELLAFTGAVFQHWHVFLLVREKEGARLQRGVGRRCLQCGEKKEYTRRLSSARGQEIQWGRDER